MSEVIITYVSIADKTASAKKQRLQFVEKVCFFKKVLVLNPIFKNYIGFSTACSLCKKQRLT